MANSNLFTSLRGALLPKTTLRNDAGAPAYALSPEATLARLAVTGCFTSTYDANAELQLERVLELAQKVDTDFLAQLALYTRKRGFMKDMPALFCAVLATRNLDRLIEIFPQVMDQGRMLRNFVQMLRSGVTGRKSLGSAPKRLIREWLQRASIRELLQASVGNHPSLADIVKMVHPRPENPAREAFYAWLIGKPYQAERLPPEVVAFERWKATRSGEIPEVPFQMLTALELGTKEWTAIARQASWQTTRMNLNTFARHGVFQFPEVVKLLAKRLADPKQIRSARVFPYQLLAAYRNMTSEIPASIREAIQDAMEIAVENVPSILGQVVICPDVSGSMSGPVTGYRKGATTCMRCIDVAALISAAWLRQNRHTRVLPFEVKVVDVPLNPRDSVMTNANRLAAVAGGGTNCSSPLALLNQEKATPDLVILVSDNESWADAQTGRGTALLAEWEILRRRQPHARLVCLDLVPNITTQAPDRDDILNVAGFSDAVFDLIAAFANGESGELAWLREIQLQPLRSRLKIA